MLFKKIKYFIKGSVSIIKGIFQKADDSYILHNQQYEQDFTNNTLNRNLEASVKYEKEDFFNSTEVKFGLLLKKYPQVRDTAIDIGCGTGWLSAKLSNTFEKVVALEPSQAALTMAKKYYPSKKYSNIEWYNGFAEKLLPTLKVEQPCLFTTATVLSHIPDNAVKKILKKVNQIAPKGSILNLCECWGKEHHQFMWHIRTKKWWQKNLPGWELDFHGPSIQNLPDRHKGIHGIKIY